MLALQGGLRVLLWGELLPADLRHERFDVAQGKTFDFVLNKKQLTEIAEDFQKELDKFPFRKEPWKRKLKKFIEPLTRWK
jgi:hypothetical protein